MARWTQRRNGQTHTAKRLGGDLQLVASREFQNREDALAAERMLTSWEDPRKAVEFLLRAEVESSPDSCRVGRVFNPHPWSQLEEPQPQRCGFMLL